MNVCSSQGVRGVAARLTLAAAVLTGAACERSGSSDATNAADTNHASVAAIPVATSLETAPDAWLEGDGVRLRYRTAGSGDPVILLHGLGDGLHMWYGTGDSLAAGHQVIALEQRGHGASSRPVGAEHYGRRMAEDVVRLLDRLGIERAHLVGHSMGAIVSSYVAVQHPERIASASLIAPPFYADSAEVTHILAPFAAEVERGEGMVGFLRHYAPELPDSLRRVFSAEVMAVNDPGALASVMRGFGAVSVGREGAMSARVPAVVITGSVDVLIVQGRQLASWWPGARMVEVAGADHVSVLWDPATLAAVREVIGGR